MALVLRYGLFDTAWSGFSRAENGARLDMTRASLNVRHHFGDGISATATIPTATLRFDLGDGERPQTLSGFGDINLAGRYDFAALWGAGGYAPSVALSFGLGLPTGVQAKFGDEGGIIPPNILSTGFGVFSANTRLDYTQAVHRIASVTASAGAAAPLQVSSAGIQNGATFDYGVGVLVHPLAWLSGSLRASGIHVEPARVGAVTSDNSGGDWAAATLAIAVRPHKKLGIVSGLRVPFFGSARGEQLGESMALFVGLSTSFGGDDHKGHDHGGDEEADDGGHVFTPVPAVSQPADIADAATGGDAVDIASVLVPGKYTVVDFWAEWCKPCHALTKDLVAFAEGRDDIAIRRIEVPTFDSDAAKLIPDASGLPVLWIYNDKGERIATLVQGQTTSFRDVLNRR